jgi:hypothetical protein
MICKQRWPQCPQHIQAALSITVANCSVIHWTSLRVLRIQLVPYDAVNRNKVSIRQLPLFLFFLLTHYMFRPLRAILRWDIQLMFPRTIHTTTDPLYIHNLTYVYIGTSTRGPRGTSYVKTSNHSLLHQRKSWEMLVSCQECGNDAVRVHQLYILKRLVLHNRCFLVLLNTFVFPYSRLMS